MTGAIVAWAMRMLPAGTAPLATAATSCAWLRTTDPPWSGPLPGPTASGDGTGDGPIGDGLGGDTCDGTTGPMSSYQVTCACGAGPPVGAGHWAHGGQAFVSAFRTSHTPARGWRSAAPAPSWTWSVPSGTEVSPMWIEPEPSDAWRLFGGPAHGSLSEGRIQVPGHCDHASGSPRRPV